MVQLSIQAVNNQNLFSNHYLENLIRKNDEWRSNDHKAVFDEIKKIYNAEKPFLADLNESQLEERFFRRIFKIMLPDFEVQAGTESQDFPDYAFFEDTNALDAAHLNKGSRSFYQNAFAIGEVKRWDTNLDRFGKGKHDKNTNPSFQIWLYLHETEPEWGVLSNGRLWRLYHQDKLLDSYYEVDLVTILEKGDIDAFKYFYYFFRMEAFFPSQKGTIFLENVLRGSEDYATEIGEDLKENVYRAMKILAEGFFRHRANGLDRNDENARSEVQSTTMRLLYRFLFLLYAEGKGLLSGSAYRKSPYSFYRIKNAIKEEKDSRNVIHEKGTRYWAELQGIFGMINAGDETLGIPAYNGGLFDSERNPNLLKWQIGDLYLADAIDLLSRSDVGNGGKRLGFVDYSSLDIRHLGSIYEGLLEYRLRVADTDMVATGGKKREWAGLEDFNSSRKRKKNFSDFNIFDRVKKDELYLSTDKGERKATGSYYTPDYIVNYIVKNTIDPVVDERWQKAKERNESLIDATLSVKVLDPAMGSGHFLVGALEHLSARLMKAVTIEAESGRIPDDERGRYTPEWAKREVASHCIYGVDLNYLAVELAKVSLWLKTIAMDKPLSFLDHRLKCGNSLIGTRLVDLKEYPSSERRGKKTKAKDHTLPSFVSRLFIDHLIGKIGELEGISDDSLSDIKRKEQVFEEFRQLPEYRKAKAIADVHTAVYFGNEVGATVNKKPEDIYHDIVWAIKGDEAEWRRKTNRVWFREAQQIAEDKSFFHWELEFPEMFFEDGDVKENPGWDAVVGNPPYIMELRENKELFRELKLSPLGQKYYEAKMDIFYFFIEYGLDILKHDANLGFIVQEYWISRAHASKLRKKIFNDTTPKLVVDFKDYQVFKEATGQHNMIIILKKTKEEDTTFIITLKDSTVKEKEILCTLLREPEKQNVFEINERKTVELYDINMDKVYLGDEAANKLQAKLSILGFNLDSTEIQQGLVTPQHYLTPKSLANLPNPEHHRPNEGIFVLSDAEFKRIEWTTDEWKVFKPFYYAEELDKYSYSTYKKYYIIYTPKEMVKQIEVHPEKYPNIKNHLDKYASVITSDNKPYGIHRARQPEWFEDTEKIISVRKTKYPKFVVVTEPYYMDQSVFIIRLVQHTEYSPNFVTSILNSKVSWWWLHQQKTQGDQLQIDKEVLLHHPIRRINFTTQPEERTALLESLKSRYNANEFDKIMQLVEECLPKDIEGNFITEKEKSNAVHDLLAFLAERMIEMNKDKNEEIKGFLGWFEREIGAKIETLTNRTKLKQYYDLDFDGLLNILKKNRKKIPVNLSNRELQGNLKDEFEGSTMKLKPLIERIEKTDELIDQVVYRLYGLTEEEIKVVEGDN